MPKIFNTLLKNKNIKSIRNFKTSNNIEELRGYDKDGQLIYCSNSNERAWFECELDSNGNIIHYSDSNGLKYWYEYDENGNIISTKIFNDKPEDNKDYL